MGVRFLPDMRHVVARSMSGAQIWEVEAARPVRRLAFPGRVTAWEVVPTSPERHLVGRRDGGLSLLDAEGSEVRTFSLTTSAMRFLGAEEPGLWDAGYNQQAQRHDANFTGFAPYSTPSSIAVSRDGAIAVAAYGQNFALVWDLASGDLVAALGRDDLDSVGSRIYRVDIGPDGRDVLLRRADGEVQVWDWRERAVRGSIRVPPEDGPWQADAARPVGAVTCGGGVGPAMFAGTGRWIAVAVANRVAVYDWPTGRQVNAWAGHQPHHPILGNHTGLPRILDLRVSADGRRALTVGVDASLRLWSVASGRQIWTDTPDVCCMDWGDLSADGRTVAWTGCPGTRLYSPRGA